MLSHVLLSSWCPITFRKLVEEVTYAWEWRKGCWNSFLTTLSDSWSFMSIRPRATPVRIGSVTMRVASVSIPRSCRSFREKGGRNCASLQDVMVQNPLEELKPPDYTRFYDASRSLQWSSGVSYRCNIFHELNDLILDDRCFVMDVVTSKSESKFRTPSHHAYGP